MTEAPDPIFAFSSDFVDELTKRSPMLATLAGIPGEHAGWDDLSPEGGAALAKFYADKRAEVDAFPPARDRWGGVARRVLREWIDERLSYYAHQDNLSDLNNIESPFQNVRLVFDLMPTATDKDWETIAARLETIGAPISGLERSLALGKERGMTAAKRQVRAVIDQARAHASETSGLRSAVADYRKEHPGTALGERLGDAVTNATEVFSAFANWLERDYLPAATDKDPYGRERYIRSANRFLGMAEFDPLEAYAWGFREIEQIETRMQEIASRLAPGSSVSDLVRSLEEHPEQKVDDLERFLGLMRDRQARALEDLMKSHFDVPEPIRRIEVKLAPPGGALGAYYVPPSEDFSRPGTVYYAPSSSKTYALFSEITTAYHEGFPGHHLQCGLQVYFRENLSRHHRLLVCCSGYAEGWALYAEQLMDELGYYEHPAYVLGMLMAKLFRACRIVADIGMHLELPIPETFDFHPGEVWSWDLTVELLSTRGFVERAFAESEATRYLGWPGQAISYKVGERVILELRDEARARLGSAFDLRAFHEAVLSAGSVGLDHLRDIVRASMS